MKKFRYYFLGITIMLAFLIIISIFYFGNSNSDIQWIKDYSYQKSQIYDFSFGLFSPCPSIPIKIGNTKKDLLFDTGNADGIILTNTLEDKVDYEIIGSIETYNADGTYRGDGKSISLKSLTVFDEEYHNVISSLTDWRLYGFLKINGTIGLKYFDQKVVTLDYKNKKIAISRTALDYSKLNNERYTVLPLIKSNESNEQDLLFFEGEVNGVKSTIYLDTGSSRSFINLDDAGKEIEVKLGDKTYSFKSNKLRSDAIGFPDNFNYPLRLAINSDLLKANKMVITIDRIQDNLIITKN